MVKHYCEVLAFSAKVKSLVFRLSRSCSIRAQVKTVPELTPFVLDNKQFVAYLSYLYDAEIETPGAEKDREATKKIVFAVQKFMEDHDYKFYDEQREANFGGTYH